MSKNKAGAGFALVIGVIIAAVAITQENYGGAVFAVVVGTIASVVLYVRSGRERGH
ncbi:hypothetical protein [Streptomyces caelestis]|jgi:O-antigen/teichoic acid export membrane protein|uniref:O-antigen/teichoic acid export membrane protein n=1 Tax=Streptomyces caelestis TaxID=36816 RepID=A0A7W9H6P3_9ACTN|nr:hypothetical protein [Streptomyces caelestis]MBB5796620.1 O-antigen/teichoic acid export membrane protein [Streptomyces caelestis]GGW40058.1 hypothetical protein GCM10010320_19360 [Streptomyces caelestis]